MVINTGGRLELAHIHLQQGVPAKFSIGISNSGAYMHVELVATDFSHTPQPLVQQPSLQQSQYMQSTNSLAQLPPVPVQQSQYYVPQPVQPLYVPPVPPQQTTQPTNVMTTNNTYVPVPIPVPTVSYSSPLYSPLIYSPFWGGRRSYYGPCFLPGFGFGHHHHHRHGW